MHTIRPVLPVVTQDSFFCHLAGPVEPTSVAIVHWVGCINAIKLWFQCLVYFKFVLEFVRILIQLKLHSDTHKMPNITKLIFHLQNTVY